jgi:CheY-like chemotaxis protein
MKILIVEDQPVNIIVLQEMIYIFCPDAQIKSAENGKIGYEILQEENFDLILSDISMPIMDGYELIEKIKNGLKLSTPAIAVTAFAIQGDKEKILLAGFDDYISKPIDIGILEEILNKYKA